MDKHIRKHLHLDKGKDEYTDKNTVEKTDESTYLWTCSKKREKLKC